jgi:hypothetical protein
VEFIQIITGIPEQWPPRKPCKWQSTFPNNGHAKLATNFPELAHLGYLIFLLIFGDKCVREPILRILQWLAARHLAKNYGQRLTLSALFGQLPAQWTGRKCSSISCTVHWTMLYTQKGNNLKKPTS